MKKIRKKAFTLIEIMVTLTIFWVIMLSVMSVYIISSQTVYNSDLNKVLHENVKNIITNFNEDISKNWIKWVDSWVSSSLCTWENLLPNTNPESEEDDNENINNKEVFCTSENKYFLSEKNFSGEYVKVDDITKCDKIDSSCFLVLEKIWDSKKYPLTNNLVTVRKSKFIVTNNKTKKITLLLQLQPNIKSWFDKKIAEKNIFYLQTSFSDRAYNKK